MRELSLYIHIPFCIRKCYYCDFLSAAHSDEEKERYTDALVKEIDCYKKSILKNVRLRTVFIGGGTPTCLSAKSLEQIGSKIQELIDENTEFTIEANPGTITLEKVQTLKKIGINRVSLGLQSAQNEELKALGRIHTYEEFLESYEMLRNNGFSNINIDLMSDIPNQTLKSYEDTLQKVIGLNPEHISAYSLIIEEGTKFYQMEQEGTLHIADEDTDRQMYHITKEMLKSAGYQRYEISNYSKNNRQCQHNTVYWSPYYLSEKVNGDYLGVGLGASSYVNGIRFSNTADLKKYTDGIYSDLDIKSISKQDLWKESLNLRKDIHILTEKEKMEEFMFLGLRLCSGISTEIFEKVFGKNIRTIYGNVIDKFLHDKLLAENTNSGKIYLTDNGIDVSNYVLSEFLID